MYSLKYDYEGFLGVNNLQDLEYINYPPNQAQCITNMCIPGTYNDTTNSMDLVFPDGMVGYFDPLIRRCVKCPASTPKCRKIIKREYWVDCTN